MVRSGEVQDVDELYVLTQKGMLKQKGEVLSSTISSRKV